MDTLMPPLPPIGVSGTATPHTPLVDACAAGGAPQGECLGSSSLRLQNRADRAMALVEASVGCGRYISTCHDSQSLDPRGWSCGRQKCSFPSVFSPDTCSEGLYIHFRIRRDPCLVLCPWFVLGHTHQLTPPPLSPGQLEGWPRLLCLDPPTPA